ncbi:MAG TPA: hypothetical protein VE573_12480 [Nitrososphaeraceae archaeon]|nr:hypothetical protein [Nitrososphaeraceae archaeon]
MSKPISIVEMNRRIKVFEQVMIDVRSCVKSQLVTCGSESKAMAVCL